MIRSGNPSSVHVADSGSGSVSSAYTYDNSYDQANDSQTDYYSPSGDLMYTEINSGSTTRSISDAVDQSSGYSYDRDMTLTYNVSGPPTETGSGSGDSWSQTDTQHGMQEDSESYFWIGTGSNGSSVDSENHVTESWSGGTNSQQTWSQTYGDSSSPVVTSTSTPSGSGTRTTSGSTTTGSSTYPYESTVPITSYGGRSSPGASFGLTGNVSSYTISPYGQSGQQQSSGPIRDGSGNPIQLVSNDPNAAVGAAAGATTKPSARPTAPAPAPSAPKKPAAPQEHGESGVKILGREVLEKEGLGLAEILAEDIGPIQKGAAAAVGPMVDILKAGEVLPDALKLTVGHAAVDWIIYGGQTSDPQYRALTKLATGKSTADLTPDELAAWKTWDTTPWPDGHR